MPKHEKSFKLFTIVIPRGGLLNTKYIPASIKPHMVTYDISRLNNQIK